MRILVRRHPVNLERAIRHQRTNGIVFSVETQVSCTGSWVHFIAEGGSLNRLGVLDPVGVVPTEPKLARGGSTEAASYVGDPTLVCTTCGVRWGTWIRFQDRLAVCARVARTSVRSSLHCRTIIDVLSRRTLGDGDCFYRYVTALLGVGDPPLINRSTRL